MMTLNLRRTALSVLMMAGVATGALAGSHGGHETHADRGQMFGKIDANSDGQISREEMDAHHAAKFASMDSNEDGAVTLDELTAEAQEKAAMKAQKKMDMIDADGDGRITPEEMVAFRHGDGDRDFFASADENGDNMLSQDEFGAMHRQHHGKYKH